ncbi:MAG: hypothetical protein OXG67_07420 [bacterium]|nr:hypothetical protein [bacterium]MCY3890131.1 hypothetical protein [bacterium]
MADKPKNDPPKPPPPMPPSQEPQVKDASGGQKQKTEQIRHKEN